MTMNEVLKEGRMEGRKKKKIVFKKKDMHASCFYIIVTVDLGEGYACTLGKGEIFSGIIFYSSYLDKSELKSSILVPCFYYHYQPLSSVNLTGPVP